MKACAVGFLVVVAVLRVEAQNGFTNLDFESGTNVLISGADYQEIEFAAAFPGWVGYLGTNATDGALYNNAFLDSAGIGLHTWLSYYLVEQSLALGTTNWTTYTNVLGDGTYAQIFVPATNNSSFFRFYSNELTSVIGLASNPSCQ